MDSSGIPSLVSMLVPNFIPVSSPEVPLRFELLFLFRDQFQAPSHRVLISRIEK